MDWDGGYAVEGWGDGGAGRSNNSFKYTRQINESGCMCNSREKQKIRLSLSLSL